MKKKWKAVMLIFSAAFLTCAAIPAAASEGPGGLSVNISDGSPAASAVQPAVWPAGAAGAGGMALVQAAAAASGSGHSFASAAGSLAVPVPDGVAGGSAEGRAMPTGIYAAEEGSSPPAALSKEEAERLARGYLEIPADYVLRGASLSGGYGTYGARSVWHLDFYKQLEDDRYSAINASIDADSGLLTQFSTYDYDPGRKAAYPPKTGLEEAKRIADGFLQRVNADRASRLKYNERFERDFIPPLTGEVYYEFLYERVDNGIVYGGDYASVTVSGDGKVVRYRFNWNDKVKFEPASDLIGKEEAMKIFAESAELGLSYLIPYQSVDRRTPQIAYALRQTSIDAKTGQFAVYQGMTPDQWSEKPLAESPLAQEPERPLNLSQEEAAQVVEKLAGLPAGARLTSASYYENLNPDTGKLRAGWYLYWTAGGEDGRERNVSASVNALTGELDSYYRDSFRPLAAAGQAGETAPKLSREEAAAKAADFVRKAVPRFAHQLYEAKSQPISIYREDETQEHYFSYKRFIDGVAGVYDEVSVSINAVSGEIIHFSNSISDYDYPDPKPGTISESEARRLLIEAYDLELRYVPFYGEEGSQATGVTGGLVAAREIYPVPGRDEAVTARPMYVLTPKSRAETLFLDATDGRWKRRDTGEEAPLAIPEATDIDGHWAELALRLMIAYEAIDVADGKVMPDKAMTRGEMIKMLVIAINGGRGGIYYGKERAATFNDVSANSALFSFVERAVDIRLIDRGDGKFRPDETMSREEMAELITRALGYDKLAAYGEMFSLNALDAADIERKGHAAIVLGLGIMSLDAGRFHPDEPVTRAQAASAFHRYLQKRAELFDSPRF